MAWPTSLFGEDGELGGPVAKNLSEEERAGLAAHIGAEAGRLRLLRRRARSSSSRALLGAARLEIGRRGGLIDEDAWSFLWVVDAPLFEPADEATAAGDVAVGSGAWTAVHHAFTSPQDLETFDQDPGNALAWAYDIVCNGNEIGGGSIRIHRARHPEAGLRGDGPRARPRRRRSSASCSTPSSTARRRTAASPSAGTGSWPCCRGPTRSAT